MLRMSDATKAKILNESSYTELTDVTPPEASDAMRAFRESRSPDYAKTFLLRDGSYKKWLDSADSRNLAHIIEDAREKNR